MIFDPSPQLDIKETEELFPEHSYYNAKFLGKGGCGSVFIVRSSQYNQDFCIKRIQIHKGNYDGYAENEATALIRLCHPNIISMYEFFFDRTLSFLYIVLEYCRGGSLKDLIERKGPIKPPLLYSYCYQILNALLHCHEQNIAHRDIKPSNILLDNYGRIKLADFGLSKMLKKGELINSFSGSRQHMAPEVILRKNVDPFLADIWSLGTTFYAIAFGYLPWGECTEEDMDMAISLGMLTFPTHADRDFCNLIRSMVVVNPAKREPLQNLVNSPLFDKIQKHNFTSMSPASGGVSQAPQIKKPSHVPASFSYNRIISNRRGTKACVLNNQQNRLKSKMQHTFA
ncbi:CAMK family protein kinase [Histomonas meleagridis]|uniref:CAMK family protein kinase n=1 Tax=Histomonas meleagridis TaxID=135588 RepID=UPI0035594B40|nr:CAMK family protein kinase [Histomonas meleagridis]KAH0800812.1 CAMK family protein kinase [Histomonas meleagridis]